MAWTTPRTWTTGETVTAAIMNTHARDNLAYLKALAPDVWVVPSARVYNDAAISINNNTITALTFNSERWDTDSIHSTVTNTGRLTATKAGIYHIHGHVAFASNSSGSRQVSIRFGASTVLAVHKIPASAGVNLLSISTVYYLAENDYVELLVYQDSGGSLNVIADAALSPEFGMTYLGKKD